MYYNVVSSVAFFVSLPQLFIFTYYRSHVVSFWCTDTVCVIAIIIYMLNVVGSLLQVY
jgi:hypothetical protein